MSRHKLLLFFFLVFFGFFNINFSATKYIFDNRDLIYPILWTRGCSPTAASMVLMFYDYYTPIGAISVGGKFFGLIVDYYRTHNISSRNVPFPLIDELAVAMGTDASGNTASNMLGPGIRDVTNNINGYNFQTSQVIDCIIPFTECWDWCWGAITNEINNNRPFVWSVTTSQGGGLGHSLAAYGYDDNKYVICRNTWDYSEDWWYYNQYDNTYPASHTYVDKVLPGGGSDVQALLDDPVGGEILYGGESIFIWWYQFGNSSTVTEIFFSSNEGATFSYVGYKNSGPGWNYFNWTVPNMTTSGARIRINVYPPGLGGMIASDGSLENFSIRATSNITVTTSPSGLKVIVDGTEYTAPQSFNWPVGSSHTIGVSSPQTGATGTRYVFSSWSDGGGQTHTITTPSSATTYTANFATQYSLTTSANPAGGGTVSPSGTNWYNSGQSVQIQATAAAGYVFSHWSGDLSGSQNPASITMDGPKNVVANFAVINYPDINLPSSKVAFGYKKVGSSTELMLVIENKGNAVLNISSINRSSGSSDLSVVDYTSSIAGSSSGYARLRFNPASTGPKEAVFSIVSNDPDEPSVSFTAIGNGLNFDYFVFAGHDFDGAGGSDISVWRPSDGVWYVRGVMSQQWGQSGDIPVNGDYNGDGTTDVAVWRPSNGMWYVRGQFMRQWGTFEDIPVPADYDGDGKIDLAVWRPSEGMWYIQYAGGGVIAIAWGVNGDLPIPGDFDGDNKADIVVWRPSNGTWYVRGQFASSWGTNGDIPVRADYNGDGKSDIAVWRPSNGVWYIQHSGGGYALQYWGTAEDIPVPGDYNGNKVADIAVWRPSTGMWYIYNIGAYQWGTSGDIPLVR